MKKRIRRGFVLLLTFTTLLATSLAVTTTVLAEENTAESVQMIDASAAFAVDFSTGKVFYNQNGDTPLAIASMTKMITLYLTLQAVKEGTLQWTDTITISDFVSEISVDTELSNVPLTAGKAYSVKDLFDASAIYSANAAAIALAEKISGSEEQFVNKMRETVQSWGIEDAYLVTCTGLNNSLMHGRIYPGSGENDENMMSARSVAIVARKLIQDFPEILEVTKTTKQTFGVGTGDEIEMTSWNWMLPGFDYYKEGVDGLKTGTTDLAGACFAGTMEKDGWRVITVVMHANQYPENTGARFEETSELLDYVYGNWEQKTILRKGEVIPDLKTLSVEKGKEASVGIALSQDVTAWLSTDMDLSKVEINFSPDSEEVNSTEALVAPVDKETEVGTATVKMTDDNLGYLDKTDATYTSPVETTGEVEKANIFVLIWRAIKEFFSNLF